MTLKGPDFVKCLVIAAACLNGASAWASPDSYRSVYASERSELIIDWRNGRSAIIQKVTNHAAIINALIEVNVFSNKIGSKCEETIDGLSFARPDSGDWSQERGFLDQSKGREIWVNKILSTSPPVSLRYLYSPAYGVREFSIFRGQLQADATYRLESGNPILGSCE